MLTNGERVQVCGKGRPAAWAFSECHGATRKPAFSEVLLKPLADIIFQPGVYATLLFLGSLAYIFTPQTSASAHTHTPIYLTVDCHFFNLVSCCGGLMGTGKGFKLSNLQVTNTSARSHSQTELLVPLGVLCLMSRSTKH